MGLESHDRFEIWQCRRIKCHKKLNLQSRSIRTIDPTILRLIDCLVNIGHGLAKYSVRLRVCVYVLPKMYPDLNQTCCAQGYICNSAAPKAYFDALSL